MAKSKICNCGCGTEFIPTKLGQKQVSQSHYITWLIHTPQGQKKQAEAKEKAKKIIAKAEKKKDKDQREKLKTLSDYESDAKKSFQKFIRLRDAELPCISCGTTRDVQYAGGHYFEAGKYSALMFDERNCHKQCNKYCNMGKSGNLLEYRKGLIRRFGIAFVDQLESESDGKRDYKYTRAELIEIKKKYDLLNKNLG